MNNSQKQRIAFIGLGDIAQKTYLPIVANIGITPYIKEVLQILLKTGYKFYKKTLSTPIELKRFGKPIVCVK